MKGTILAFMLVTVIEGNVAQGSDQMLFRDIHRCQQFAYWIEHNCRDVRCRGGIKQHNITAYCKPVMAGANQKLFYIHEEKRFARWDEYMEFYRQQRLKENA